MWVGKTWYILMPCMHLYIGLFSYCSIMFCAKFDFFLINRKSVFPNLWTPICFSRPFVWRYYDEDYDFHMLSLRPLWWEHVYENCSHTSTNRHHHGQIQRHNIYHMLIIISICTKKLLQENGISPMYPMLRCDTAIILDFKGILPDFIWRALSKIWYFLHLFLVYLLKKNIT